MPPKKKSGAAPKKAVAAKKPSKALAAKKPSKAAAAKASKVRGVATILHCCTSDGFTQFVDSHTPARRVVEPNW